MNKWINTVLVMLLAAATAPAEPNARQIAMASELLRNMGSERQAREAMEQLRRSQEAMVRSARLSRDQEAQQREMQGRISAIIAEEFSWDKWSDAYTRVYADVLSEREMKDLNNFFLSESGKSYVEKSPQIQQQIQKLVLQRMSNVNQRARAVVREYAPAKPPARPADATPRK